MCVCVRVMEYYERYVTSTSFCWHAQAQSLASSYDAIFEFSYLQWQSINMTIISWQYLRNSLHY